MTYESNQSDVKVGFIGFFDIEHKGGLRGAAMVTNERGFPLEFQVSTPVRPTAVQRALYGASLEPYVTAELLGARLARALKQNPAAIFVNRMGGLAAHIQQPVAFIAHADSFVRQENDGLHYRRIESPSGAAALVLLSEVDDGFEQLGHLVAEAFRHFDPVEAFDRMRTALDVLAQSDDRYR